MAGAGLTRPTSPAGITAVDCEGLGTSRGLFFSRSKMTPVQEKILQCFVIARRVIHYYWVHTGADEHSGRLSIENLHHIVERLIRLPIQKLRVFSTDTTTVRGSYERYSDHIKIYIRDGQGELWERFTIVKELSHALAEQSHEYSVNVLTIVKELKQFDGLLLKIDEMSAASLSEKMAELIALEIIYPVEFRLPDRAARDAGESLGAIAVRRGLPTIWVEHALGTHLDSAQAVWGLLPIESFLPSLPQVERN